MGLMRFLDIGALLRKGHQDGVLRGLPRWEFIPWEGARPPRHHREAMFPQGLKQPMDNLGCGHVLRLCIRQEPLPEVAVYP